MTMTTPPSEILTPAEVADWLGIPVKALANWRSLRRGPAYTRLGRMVRYERTAIESFIAAGRVDTAQLANSPAR